MKKRISFKILIGGIIFFQSVYGANLNQEDEYGLELKISCPVEKLQVGDEIPIVFTIINNGDRDYQYDIRNYDRSGRLLEYRLQAKDKDGKIVPDPRKDLELGLMGGLGGGQAAIGKGQSFDYTLALNRWALINKPGNYTVTATYTYDIEDKDAVKIPDTIMMKTIKVQSKPIEIEVKSRSSRQMGRYIESLQKELKELQSSNKREIREEREQTILKLDYTCDERIISTLIDLIYLNQHNNDVFWAIEGFRCYLPKTPEIRNQLIGTIKNRGFASAVASVLESYNCDESIFNDLLIKALNSDKPNIVSEAALIAQNHPSDGITPLLISAAKGNAPNHQGMKITEITRERAIYALARNRTDEVIEALKELNNDPDDRICRAVQTAIEEAYRIHPIYPEQTDEKYTAMLIPAAMDTNYPRSIFFVMEILRTRTEKGVEAIKKLAENPELDIPVAETDSGVKAIRDLLKSPDEKRRALIADYIEFIYRPYPGRAFREDDFPEEFQEILETRKARYIEMIETWKKSKK